MRSWYSLFLLPVLLISCEERFVVPETDPGYDFFPLETGSFRIYEVMEINFDASGSDTLYYDLRNTLTQRVMVDGQEYFVLKREQRADEAATWEIKDNWTLRRDQFTGVVVEENIPYVKMAFPVILDNVWDGHAFNTLGATEYQYIEASDAAYDDAIGGVEKIRVQLSDIPQNLVNRDQRFEVYAKGIGLVEKNYIILNYCTSNCGSEEVDSGMIIEQVLTAYGQD